jgi:UDP-glucose:glycoprotein glucosyltransferase
MRGSAPLLGAKALLALSAISRIGALADSNINVALKASFSPAPYLVELL